MAGGLAGGKMSEQKWLSVIGVGAEGLQGLSAVAQFLLSQAAVIVGGQRHLAMLPETDLRTKLAWDNPLTQTLEKIVGFRGTAVCVLASGDPLFYGIGKQLLELVPMDEMTIIPAVSSVALACSRLGWAWTEVEVISLCGRPLALLNGLLYPGAKIMALSGTGETPSQVAQLLTQQGYGESTLNVLENLGHPQETISRRQAQAWGDTKTAPLNIIGIDCQQRFDLAQPEVFNNSRLAGLPDIAYHHDGQLTKQEVRAMTLAALAPLPGQLLWDVGAGCGSIGIEWLRTHPRCQALAIEQHPQRLKLIAENATNLGTPNLEIIQGSAPDILGHLPSPDAIFIGGGVHISGMLETCWQALKPGGRLVVNAVTVTSEQVMFNWQQQVGGTLRRIAIQRAEPLGSYQAWRSLAPVTQWQVIKSVS